MCDMKKSKICFIKTGLRKFNKIIRKTRVLPPALKNPEKLSLRASMSVEAAIVIPLFLVFVLGMASFLIMFGNHTDIQNGMREAAETLTRRAYYLERTEAESIGINPLTIKSEIKKNVKNAEDISAAFSTYDAESGILDMVINYDYKIPFLPGQTKALNNCQRLRCRAWIGSDMTEGISGGNESDETIVYVTETGTVYHKTKSCSYLDLSIHSVGSQEITDLRNKSGAKYYGCPLCAKSGKPASIVYVTDYGTSWHNTTACSGLKRKIKQVDISKVQNLKPCSKCGGEH